MKIFIILVAAVSASLALPSRRTYLVTMEKEQLMTIIKCVNRSPNLCPKFEACEKLLPKQILEAYELCQRKCIGGGLRKCSPYEPRYVSPEIPVKIFDCIVENTYSLKPEERRQIVEFEKCSKDLYIEFCKRPAVYY